MKKKPAKRGPRGRRGPPGPPGPMGLARVTTEKLLNTPESWNTHWKPLAEDTMPGLYVQKTYYPQQKEPAFEVVRVVVCDGGSSKVKIGVYTPDQEQQHNPIVVSQSSYQKISE